MAKMKLISRIAVARPHVMRSLCTGWVTLFVWAQSMVPPCCISANVAQNHLAPRSEFQPVVLTLLKRESKKNARSDQKRKIVEMLEGNMRESVAGRVRPDAPASVVNMAVQQVVRDRYGAFLEFLDSDIMPAVADESVPIDFSEFLRSDVVLHQIASEIELLGRLLPGDKFLVVKAMTDAEKRAPGATTHAGVLQALNGFAEKIKGSIDYLGPEGEAPQFLLLKIETLQLTVRTGYFVAGISEVMPGPMDKVFVFSGDVPPSTQQAKAMVQNPRKASLAEILKSFGYHATSPEIFQFERGTMFFKEGQTVKKQVQETIHYLFAHRDGEIHAAAMRFLGEETDGKRPNLEFVMHHVHPLKDYWPSGADVHASMLLGLPMAISTETGEGHYYYPRFSRAREDALQSKFEEFAAAYEQLQAILTKPTREEFNLAFLSQFFDIFRYKIPLPHAVSTSQSVPTPIAIPASFATPGLTQVVPVSVTEPTKRDVVVSALTMDDPDVENKLNQAFNVMLASGVLPNRVWGIREIFRRSPREFMRKTQVILARDQVSGNVIGAAFANANFSRRLSEEMMKGDSSKYKEPIAYIKMAGVDPLYPEEEVGPPMMAAMEEALRNLKQATAFCALQDQMEEGFMLAHGYQLDPKLFHVAVKILGNAEAPQAVDPSLWLESDPLIIVELIRDNAAIRAAVKPPEGALIGLAKKMGAKKKVAAELLKTKIPNVRQFFPNVDAAMAGKGKRSKSTPPAPAAPFIPSNLLKHFQNFYAAHEKAGQDHEQLIRKEVPDAGEKDLEVIRLYRLARSLGEGEKEVQAIVLGYLESKRVITSLQRKLLEKNINKSPAETLKHLAIGTEGATEAGAQNLYGHWLDALFHEGRMAESDYHELDQAVREGKIYVLIEGHRVPFSVFYTEHPALREKWGAKIARWEEPWRLAEHTSNEARDAAAKDILVTVERVFSQKVAKQGRFYFVNYRETCDARRELPHMELPRQPGAIILELGCAIGSFLREAKRQLGPAHKQVVLKGVEIRPDFVAQAKEMNQLEGFPDIDIREADAFHLDFISENETVSMVVLQQFMNHLHSRSDFQEMAEIVPEIDRVAAIGATINLIDDSNTPLFSYRLFTAAGYVLTKRQVIPAVTSYGDNYLLLTFTKVRSHQENQTRLARLGEIIPIKIVRPNSPLESEYKAQLAQVERAWLQIPEPVAMLPAGPLQPVVPQDSPVAFSL